MKLVRLFCWGLLLLAPQVQAGTSVARELDEVARVGSIMVDGDLCQKIVTQRALSFLLKNNPQDKWEAGDNYDVNAAEFISTKKTLIRLSRLAAFPYDVNLWMPIEGHPDKVQVVVRNVNEMSQFWEWGALHQEMLPEMKSVLETGLRSTVSKKIGWISVLAPVYNSLGDRVGIIEVVTRIPLDTHENVK